MDSVRGVTVEVSRDGSAVATLTNFKRDTENNCLIFMPWSRSQCDNWQAGIYEFKAKVSDTEKTLEDVEFKESHQLKVLAVPVKANYAGDIVEPGNQWKNGGAFMRPHLTKPTLW